MDPWLTIILALSVIPPRSMPSRTSNATQEVTRASSGGCHERFSWDMYRSGINNNFIWILSSLYLYIYSPGIREQEIKQGCFSESYMQRIVNFPSFFFLPLLPPVVVVGESAAFLVGGSNAPRRNINMENWKGKEIETHVAEANREFWQTKTFSCSPVVFRYMKIVS